MTLSEAREHIGAGVVYQPYKGKREDWSVTTVTVHCDGQGCHESVSGADNEPPASVRKEAARRGWLSQADLRYGNRRNQWPDYCPKHWERDSDEGAADGVIQ